MNATFAYARTESLRYVRRGKQWETTDTVAVAVEAVNR